MTQSLVLTVIGDDQPGLVRTLARVVDEHGGSWQVSRMAHLAGKFAGILRAEVPDQRVAELETALRALTPSGLHVVVEESGPAQTADTPVLRIELVGHDRPGLLRELSRALADLGVNIDELYSESRDAPMSGGLLFDAQLRVRLPHGVPVDDLRTSLEELAQEIMVDITVDDAGPT